MRRTGGFLGTAGTVSGGNTHQISKRRNYNP
jgi:hypothetical protein